MKVYQNGFWRHQAYIVCRALLQLSSKRQPYGTWPPPLRAAKLDPTSQIWPVINLSPLRTSGLNQSLEIHVVSSWDREVLA